jgi:hypothetical protein
MNNRYENELFLMEHGITQEQYNMEDVKKHNGKKVKWALITLIITTAVFGSFYKYTEYQEERHKKIIEEITAFDEREKKEFRYRLCKFEHRLTWDKLKEREDLRREERVRNPSSAWKDRVIRTPFRHCSKSFSTEQESLNDLRREREREKVLMDEYKRAIIEGDAGRDPFAGETLDSYEY